jgi:hypothetical protein
MLRWTMGNRDRRYESADMGAHLYLLHKFFDNLTVLYQMGVEVLSRIWMVSHFVRRE